MWPEHELAWHLALWGLGSLHVVSQLIFPSRAAQHPRGEFSQTPGGSCRPSYGQLQVPEHHCDHSVLVKTLGPAQIQGLEGLAFSSRRRKNSKSSYLLCPTRQANPHFNKLTLIVFQSDRVIGGSASKAHVIPMDSTLCRPHQILNWWWQSGYRVASGHGLIPFS